MDKRARERDKDKGLPPSKRKAKGKLVEGQITTDQIQGPGPAPPPPTPTESTPTCKTLTQKTGQAFLETPDQTPPPTTLRSSAGRWTRLGSAPDPVERCWCALIVPEAQRRPPGFLTHRRVSYSVGFTLPDHTPQIHGHHPRDRLDPGL